MVNLFRKSQSRSVDFDLVSNDFSFLTGSGLEALTVILDADITNRRHLHYLLGTYGSYQVSIMDSYRSYIQKQDYFEGLLDILKIVFPGAKDYELIRNTADALGEGKQQDVETIIKLANRSVNDIRTLDEIPLPARVEKEQLDEWQNIYQEKILPQALTRKEYSIAGFLNLIGELINLGGVRLGKSPIGLTEGKYKHYQSKKSFIKERKKSHSIYHRDIMTDEGAYRKAKDSGRRQKILELVQARYNRLVEKSISAGGESINSAVAKIEGFGIDPHWFITYMSCAVYAINSPGNHPIPALRLYAEADSLSDWIKDSYASRPDDYRSLGRLPGVGKDSRYN
jgi:hypothetical protein